MARVKYLKSTLREVIFQVRFPKIIKLMEEAPAAFQDLIIGQYPIYSVQQNETVVEFNGKPQQQLNENNHCFISTSGKTKINLTSSFFAVSTLEYERWEMFKKEIEEVLDKFYVCYNIPGIQRIGLRYQNIIFRSQLGLAGKPWAELLAPSVLGPLAIREDITNYITVYELKNSDDCFTNHHYELVKQRKTNELAMKLDCDYYYTGFFKKEAVPGLSENLHDLSQKFIEESHKIELRTAMQPQELEPWQVT